MGDFVMHRVSPAITLGLRLASWNVCALLAVAGSNPFIALYFYAFLVIGSFFAINLFIGVVIDKFSRMKEEFEGSAFQTKVSYPDLLRASLSTSCWRPAYLHPLFSLSCRC